MRVALVTALVGAGAAGLPATAAQAGVFQGTLVKTTWTGGPNSGWSVPSPDPAGITYNSRTGTLLISDSEVEETGPAYPNAVWQGTNLFEASLQGQLLTTGLSTMAYTAEPTGVSFRAPLATPGYTFPERLFVSDDDRHKVFEVNAGPDKIYGNGDDTQTSFDVAFLDQGPEVDAEDVAMTVQLTQNGQALIIDGLNKRAFVYDPGPDHIFNGRAAEGHDDFIARVIDVGAYGAGDPEGIGYNAYHNSILVLDDPTNSIYEIAMDGTLMNTVTLNFQMNRGQGIAIAPASNGSGAMNAYIIDGGIDNDFNQSTFNDGRFYEVSIPGLLAPSGGTPPPPPPPASLPYSHDFSGDNVPDVVATRADGAMTLYAGNGRGGFVSSYPQIGAGWGSRDMIRHVGDFDGNGTRDLIARDPSNGNLWLYTGNGRGGFSGQRVIGAGWNAFSEIIAPGDWTGDGKPDLLTVRPNGAMNLYPGNGQGGFGSSYPQIGSGWGSRNQIISVGDWDGDRRNDIVARDPGNGNLWLYSGNGAGAFASQRVIGAGWGGFNALVGPGDFNGDGAADILARQANGDLYLYPGNGRGGFGSSYPKIGAGWSSLRIVGAAQR